MRVHRLLIALLVVLVGLTGSAAAQDKIVIKAGHVLAPSEPTHVALLKWAERMKERTHGRVEIWGPIIERIASDASSSVEPIDDLRGTVDYKRHLVHVLVRRALSAAAQH